MQYVVFNSIKHYVVQDHNNSSSNSVLFVFLFRQVDVWNVSKYCQLILSAVSV